MSALIEQIEALLDLDANGRLVPHGIGGLARELLTRAITELLSYRSEGVSVKAILAAAHAMSPNSAGDYARCFGDLVRLIEAEARRASSTERAETIEGWQPIETAVRSPKERDILLFARFEDQGGGFIEDVRIGRWVSCTGPNGLIDGWESDEGVHPDGYFSLWMPLPEPPRALNPRDGGGQ